MFDSKQWFGWWYISIGIGFALLALRNLIAGGRTSGIVLRVIIAVGFLILGAATLRPARRS
jgi:hypothetical protein